MVRRQITTNLEHIRPNYKGLPYYADGAPIQAFIGVPVREGDQVRGVLCGDRLADRPFTAREEEVFESAIRQVLRALENERVFVQLERGKREQGILFSASQMLGAALNEAAGFLRNGLFKRLQIHTVPTLHFHFDRTTERAAELNILINQANANRAKDD